MYGARNKIARCELESNAISASSPIEFSILDLSTFVKVLSTVSTIHENDFSDLKFIADLPFVRFESKKFKTKLSTCNEDVISKWVSKKIDESKFTPVFEFTTTSDWLRRVNSHSYIFPDPNCLKVYLETKDDMEKNTLFATLGNKETDLNNEMTLKCGLVTYGKLDDRKIIIDLERLNLFNAFSSDSIKISLMSLNVLVSKVKAVGKNDSAYLNMTVYNSILKN